MTRIPQSFPALIFQWPSWPEDEVVERLLAELDDFAPSATDDDGEKLRVFFGDARRRDAALTHITAIGLDVVCESADVPDEYWAERSQAALTAIRVGRIVVTPPWDDAATSANQSADDLVIVIEPSMGFGTGHHASTRACLGLLQRASVSGARVLDVGTGSGVLALAAWRLGAAAVLALDYDVDAIASARENVDRGGDAARAIELRVCDLGTAASTVEGPFDVVLGNLTAAVLARLRTPLAALLRPGGVLIASGFQIDEEAGVVETFRTAGLAAVDRVTDQDWMGVMFTSPTTSTGS